MAAAGSVVVAVPEDLNFAFGFDDPNFSDRILQLDIINTADNDSLWARHTKTRTHDDVTNDVIHCDLEVAPQQKNIHINSMILAAKSHFFRKLFSNGMRESENKHFTLQIEASEERSFKDFLNYVYSNILPTTLHALLDLLVIADKFEAHYCMSQCCRLLQDLPMTLESACLYWYLPPTVLSSTAVLPLVNASKRFLIAHFNNFDESEEEMDEMEEMINLPLPGVQAVLSSEKLQVTSEDVVYDTVMTWAQKHYPNEEERRDVLKTHLLHLVRFPFMTTRTLIEDVQSCSDIDPEFSSQMVIQALYFKADAPECKGCLGGKKGSLASRQFLPRAYKDRLIKMLKFESSQLQQCVVHLNLTKVEVARILPKDEISSESFQLGKQELALIVGCNPDNQSSDYKFWVGLHVMEGGGCTLSYELGRKRSTGEAFEQWSRGNLKASEAGYMIYLKTLGWKSFIGGKTNDFRRGILQLRLDLTIT